MAIGNRILVRLGFSAVTAPLVSRIVGAAGDVGADEFGGFLRNLAG